VVSSARGDTRGHPVQQLVILVVFVVVVEHNVVILFVVFEFDSHSNIVVEVVHTARSISRPTVVCCTEVVDVPGDGSHLLESIGGCRAKYGRERTALLRVRREVSLEHGEALVRGAVKNVRRHVAELLAEQAEKRLVRLSRLAAFRPIISANIVRPCEQFVRSCALATLVHFYCQCILLFQRVSRGTRLLFPCRRRNVRFILWSTSHAVPKSTWVDPSCERLRFSGGFATYSLAFSIRREDERGVFGVAVLLESRVRLRGIAPGRRGRHDDLVREGNERVREAGEAKRAVAAATKTQNPFLASRGSLIVPFEIFSPPFFLFCFCPPDVLA